MQYEIYSFSSYKDYFVRSGTPNISNIIDKLLRITAKITESFAGDIVYLINSLNGAVEDGCRYEKIIQFRETGVSWFNISEETVELCSNSATTNAQYWRLLHEPNNDNICETTLERVCLKSKTPFPTYLGGH